MVVLMPQFGCTFTAALKRLSKGVVIFFITYVEILSTKIETATAWRIIAIVDNWAVLQFTIMYPSFQRPDLGVSLYYCSC